MAIVLEAGETAFIPLKFQSFLSGSVRAAENAAASNNLEQDPAAALDFPQGLSQRGGRRGGNSIAEPIRHRIIQINIDSLSDPSAAFSATAGSSPRSTMAYLRVDVRPVEPTIDRTLRFAHWADDILKDRIELPRPAPANSVGRQMLIPSSGSGQVQGMNDTYITPSAGVLLDGLLAASRGGRSRVNTFALQHAEQGDINQSNLHVLSSSQRIVKVSCSSDDVAFDFVAASDGATRNLQDGALADIAFRIRMGSYGSSHRFLLALYTDVYGAALHSVIQVVATAHLRAELSAVVGQRTGGRIFLPPTERPRRVQMISSSLELSFGQAGAALAAAEGQAPPPFMLAPGAVNTLDYVYHTTAAGKRSLLLHLVDVDSHTLVQSWCLFVSAVYPRVSNTFNLILRCGSGNNQPPARKAFDYENSYKIARKYVFESSNSEKVKIREQTVIIPPLQVVSANTHTHTHTKQCINRLHS